MHHTTKPYVSVSYFYYYYYHKMMLIIIIIIWNPTGYRSAPQL